MSNYFNSCQGIFFSKRTGQINEILIFQYEHILNKYIEMVIWEDKKSIMLKRSHHLLR